VPVTGGEGLCFSTLRNLIGFDSHQCEKLLVDVDDWACDLTFAIAGQMR
jgi:hypothetical protein